MLRQEITKPGTWLHSHPWMVVGFLLGVNAGALLLHFMIQSESSDAVAALIGSMLGSGLAVAGAVWISRQEEIRKKVSLREYAEALTASIDLFYKEFLEIIDNERRAASKERDALTLLSQAVSNAVSQADESRPLFHIDATQAIRHQQFVAGLRLLESTVSELLAEVKQPYIQMYGWERTDFTKLRGHKNLVSTFSFNIGR